jgi:hypothetical protein
MDKIIGYLMLLPYAGISWLAVKIAGSSAKKGGRTRLLGIIASFILGGICIGLGYWGAFKGYLEWRGNELYQVTYPVWGWIGIVVGGIIILFCSLRALTMTKRDIEIEEENEKLKKIEDETPDLTHYKCYCCGASYNAKWWEYYGANNRCCKGIPNEEQEELWNNRLNPEIPLNNCSHRL